MRKTGSPTALPKRVDEGADAAAGEDKRRIPDSRAEALDGAKLLLHYAIKQGVELPEAITKTLIEITNDIEAKGWNAVSELTFWAAYAELAKTVRPVTAESLRAIAYGNSRPPRPVTEVVLTSVVTGIALLLLLMLQIYWVIGSNIVSTIDRLAAENIRVETQGLAAQYQLESLQEASMIQLRLEQAAEPAPQPSPTLPVDANAEMIRLRLEYDTNSRLLNEGQKVNEANYALLNDWRRSTLNIFGSETENVVGIVPAPTEQPGEADPFLIREAKALSNTIALSDAKSTLQSLASYVLPLLYGLVGACAYVLRAISRDMRDVVFFAGSPVHYRLRLLLGALSGIAIGWFFTPQQLPSGLAGIQPLALAFLAGYSVELLFAAMDRFISAFSGESRPTNQGK